MQPGDGCDEGKPLSIFQLIPLGDNIVRPVGVDKPRNLFGILVSQPE